MKYSEDQWTGLAAQLGASGNGKPHCGKSGFWKLMYSLGELSGQQEEVDD